MLIKHQKQREKSLTICHGARGSQHLWLPLLYLRAGRSGGVVARGSGEPDGTSRGSGEPDGTSRALGSQHWRTLAGAGTGGLSGSANSRGRSGSASWTGPAGMVESWTGPAEKQERACEERPQEGAVLELAQEGAVLEPTLGALWKHGHLGVLWKRGHLGLLWKRGYRAWESNSPWAWLS